MPDYEPKEYRVRNHKAHHVHAVQYDGTQECFEALSDWANAEAGDSSIIYTVNDQVVVDTQLGEVGLNDTEWLIRLNKGNYTVKGPVGFPLTFEEYVK